MNPPRPGPELRTDLVDVYVFRRTADPHRIELLQLRRTRPPAKGVWMPVMGHIEQGERAAEAAIRELREETALDLHTTNAPLWALEQVRPYFVPSIEAVVMSPRFAVEAPAQWQPSLNNEHDAARWTPLTLERPTRDELNAWLWPGQRDAITELVTGPALPNSPLADALRIDLPAPDA